MCYIWCRWSHHLANNDIVLFPSLFCLKQCMFSTQDGCSRFRKETCNMQRMQRINTFALIVCCISRILSDLCELKHLLISWWTNMQNTCKRNSQVCSQSSSVQNEMCVAWVTAAPCWIEETFHETVSAGRKKQWRHGGLSSSAVRHYMYTSSKIIPCIATPFK